MKKALYVLFLLLPYLTFAAGAPEPRWEAPDQPVLGPVKQVITQETRYGHFKTPAPVHVKWVYEYNDKQELQREQYFHITDENEKLMYEKRFENNIEIKRTGDYFAAEFFVDEEQSTIIRVYGSQKIVFHYSKKFERLMKVEVYEKGDEDYEGLFTDLYHYGDRGRLISVMREQKDMVFASKTVHYDGADYKFDSPYFLDVEPIGQYGISLHSSSNIIGHKTIEVFDPQGRRMRLLRRRVLTGSRKNPMTLEEAEKMVETVESLFDENGSETMQKNYVEGSEYIYFRSEFSNYDRYNNWRERRVFAPRDNGTEYVYSESSRKIAYY
jgi:hypothetical protein